MPATDKEVHALHRYLIWSIHMRGQCLRLNGTENVPEDIVEKRIWLFRPFMYLSLWLALLFVVAKDIRSSGSATRPSTECSHRRTSISCVGFEMAHFIISATTLIGALQTS